MHCKDHLGNSYNSVNAMCDAYGISAVVFRNRRRKGMTLEEALMGYRYTDHEGRHFRTKKDMCDFYHIKVTTYLGRLKNGMSQKDALTLPLEEHTSCFVKDHLGNTYKSLKRLASAYNMKERTLRARLYEFNWSMEKSLTTPVVSGRRPRSSQ